MDKTNSLQNDLKNALTTMKIDPSRASYNPDQARKTVEDTIRQIELNQQINVSNDQALDEIKKRCQKYVKNSQLNRPKNAMNQEINCDDSDSIIAILTKHQTMVNEIQDRLHHDVEMSIQQLGLIQNSEGVNDDIEDDFYVEEIPQATIIRHK